MYRRGDRPGRLAPLVLAPLRAAATPGAAEVSSPLVTGIEMTDSVRQALKQPEEQWLDWRVQSQPREADQAADGVPETARQIGRSRRPDLAAGAVARAGQAA